VKYDTQKFIDTLKLAIEAAKAADPGQDADGGTCNFDSAYLRVPGMRESQFEKISAAVGDHHLSLSTYSWHGRILMLRAYNGQANRRTIMAEAAGKVFKESGLDSGIYYQMD
jgi:hypothetical protein